MREHLVPLFRTVVTLVALGGQVACTTHTALGALSITDPAAQGQVPLGGGSGGGLSGLTYVAGDLFLTVSDGATLFEATIAIDSNAGLITGAPAIGGPVTLVDGIDVEAVAYDPTDDTLVISDEVGPAVRRHQRDGALIGPIALPGVYANVRPGLSLESVARQANGDLWTANEEALTGDGPAAGLTTGSAVRISNLTTGGQWVYVSDPVATNIGVKRSGVVDLVALADGKLLVLEREASFGFRNRVYAVDPATGTDVAGVSMLDADGDNDLSDETWTPVSKSLLWQGSFLLTNFEGMALGPALDNGDRSLLLVSDDDDLGTQNLYMLHLQGAPVPLLAGDANNDGLVTGADLISVQQNFAAVEAGSPTGTLAGDANDDGIVTGADLISVQQNFGQTLAPPAVPNPEPATILVFATGAWLIGPARHRRATG